MIDRPKDCAGRRSGNRLRRPAGERPGRRVCKEGWHLRWVPVAWLQC